MRDVVRAQLKETHDDLEYQVCETRDAGTGRFDELYLGVTKVPYDFVLRAEWLSIKAVRNVTPISTNPDSTETPTFESISSQNIWVDSDSRMPSVDIG